MKIDLKDPDIFAANAFWDVLAHLRREAPVYRHPESDEDGFWVLSRYHDIVSVYADSATFRSGEGMRLDSDPAAVRSVSQRMLIVSDPPDHTDLKRVLGTAFSGPGVAALRTTISRVVHDVVAQAVEAGELDFVDAVKQIPNYVVCGMMGIPRPDWAWLGDVTTAAFEGDTDEVRAAAHGEIFLYFAELLDDRRRRPGDDFVSQLIAGERRLSGPGNSRPLSDEEIIFNCNGVLAGANETTRYSAAGGVLAFAERPTQWRQLSAAGAAGVAAAVEETLRWTVPGIHAMRTAVSSTTIAGTPISPGDRVTLWNASANRDETVFPDASEFQWDRDPNRHLSFGAGRHLCLGARLARLELAELFAHLGERVERFELIGEPAYTSSNFTWGLVSLPIRIVGRAQVRL